jgi:type VI secretion system protein ImpM
MEQDDLRIPGWYGKIPSLGDFASRRLPPEFVARWDAWLQAVIAASREQLGASWLDAYLRSPVWRFLLFPGICGTATWTGVLMPSVDKVGRYFPLTVGARLPALPNDPGGLHRLSDWFEGIEASALATLDTRYSAQQFETALSSHRLPQDADPAAADETAARQLARRLRGNGRATETLVLQSAEGLPGLLPCVAADVLEQCAGGRSLWWWHRQPAGSTVLLCCDGLPSGRDFADMLHGTAG